MIQRLPLSAPDFSVYPPAAPTTHPIPQQGAGDSTNSQSTLPHILLILDCFPKNLGGGERIALRLAESLPQYGFRASILTFSIHPESPILSTPWPFPVYLLPLTRTYDLTALQSALELGRFLRRHQVRLVQTFFESSDLWAGLVTKALSPAKLIWSRRDMGILRSSKHARAYRLLNRLPDLVFAVSDQVRQHAIATDHVPPARVRTLYNGIEASQWSSSPSSPHLLPTQDLHVTSVGNIRRVKGHDLFIRAAALVLEQVPSASFSIVGQPLEPAYYAELQRLIADLRLTRHFQLLTSPTNLREHLAGSALFVLPSRSEGFSNAILEAMASSLPVVATRVGGNAEAVLQEVTGLVVPPEDPQALAHGIVQLLSNQPLLHQLGEAGKHRVDTLFSTRAMMQMLAAAYNELLPASHP